MQGGGGGGRGRGRGGRNSLFEFPDPFAGFGGFGGFGGHGSLMSSFFGGRDLFDDPFCTHPFGGGMFQSSFFGPMGNPFLAMHPSGLLEQRAVPEPTQPRGPIIEEINSDDEKEDADKERKENPRKHGRSGSGPYVEDPDDEAEEKKFRHLQYGNDYNGFNRAQREPQAHSFTFQSSSVTYGGANGAYYTTSKTRRMGSDGLTIEESKEADSSTGQASHRLSRALHNKGHSLERKLNSDGKVDTMQTLHNLNEDELGRFEEAWKGTAQKYLPGWPGNFSGHQSAGASSSGHIGQGGWALPSTESSQPSGRRMSNARDGVASSRSQHSGRMRTPDVRDRSSYSRGSTGW